MPSDNTAPVQLTPLGKLFFASLVSWIMNGTKFNWNVKGEPEKIEIMAKAVIASKQFQDELKRPGATVESVIEKLNQKNAAALEFETQTGMKWLL